MNVVDDNTFNKCINISIAIFGNFGLIAGFAVPLIYGIFALIPTGPFIKSDIQLGVYLIVSSVSGIAPCTGAVIGGFIGISLVVSLISTFSLIAIIGKTIILVNTNLLNKFKDWYYSNRYETIA